MGCAGGSTGSASFNPSGIAIVGGLDCASATTCVAGGDVLVLSASTTLVPFLINENNGLWAPWRRYRRRALSRVNEAALTRCRVAPRDCAAAETT